MNDLVPKIDEKCKFPAKIEYGSFSVPFTYFSLPNREIGTIFIIHQSTFL